jgi:cytochrome c peroxidase
VRRFLLLPILTTLFAVLAVTLVARSETRAVDPLTPQEQLGKFLFFDKALSAEGNQSCASCHAPAVGWTGPDESFNKAGAVYEGSIKGRFGNRKPPSAAYATVAPSFHLMHPGRGMFVGGNFWDGRATGEILGNPAADQAMGPFLNPVEQALPNAEALVNNVCTGPYAALFKEVWGHDACVTPDKAYRLIALSIAAYEASSEVNAFSSKYDAYLDGQATLTAQEMRGLQLFAGKARCAMCHPHQPGRDGSPPLFTDFTFENLGLPANPEHPLGAEWRDEGLGGYLSTTDAYQRYAATQLGRHRVPTLRNVDLRPRLTFIKAYGHNGYFKSLESIVHFYNTRDLLPTCRRTSDRAGTECWPAPEVPANINRNLLGALALTADEETALVAFLRTLSDGYRP